VTGSVVAESARGINFGGCDHESEFELWPNSREEGEEDNHERKEAMSKKAGWRHNSFAWAITFALGIGLDRNS
jgi:hypothetical protein